MEVNNKMRNWQYSILIIGVFVCLIVAFLMWDGSILGDRTTGIATVVGIVGISIIVKSKKFSKKS
jgi:hypothetical protein